MADTIGLPSGLFDLLVGEGIVSRSDAFRIRNQIRESWVPIGEVLLQLGHLTTAQLMDLVQIQALEPHLRLGEIAVREGYCTQEQIVDAVQCQRETNQHPLEVLLEEVPCDRDRLWSVVIRYVRQIESRLADLPVQV